MTMVEVGSARLTSLKRVTTGAGSVSRGARAKPNSLGRSLQPSLSGDFYPKLVIYGQKMPNNSGTDRRYDKFNVYHNTMLTARYQFSWRSNRRKQSGFLMSSCTVFISNQQYQLECGPNALGVENFHAAIILATQMTSISRKISLNPSPIDVNRV